MIDETEVMEKYIILLLGVVDRPVPSELHLEKELFIITRVNPQAAKYITFEKHYYGPFSVEVKDLVNNPFLYPGAFKVDKYGIRLTEKGKKAYEEIVKQNINNPRFKQLLQLLKMTRELYDKLTRDELLFLIYITYPEYAEKSKVYNELMRKKKVIAKELLNKGIITPERYKEIVEEN